jgi:hypothetical protein
VPGDRDKDRRVSERVLPTEWSAPGRMDEQVQFCSAVDAVIRVIKQFIHQHKPVPGALLRLTCAALILLREMPWSSGGAAGRRQPVSPAARVLGVT